MEDKNTNYIDDSDIEYDDESDSDTDTTDTDDSDTEVPIQSTGGSDKKNYPKFYPKFTDRQRKAYHEICNMFTNKKSVIVTINSRSGTGKTFLLTALAQQYAQFVQFITFRRDQASGISKKLRQGSNAQVETYTYISFYIKCFDLHYYRAIKLFNMSDPDDTDVLYKLIAYAKRYNNTNTNIIIVDSCTLPSATMLLLLYIISLTHRIHLIFAGNKIQLSAMYKSWLHSRNNFDIIEQLSDLVIKRLTGKRSLDERLKRKLQYFRKMIKHDTPKVEVPFHFNLRYHLYRCFRLKYFAEERFDAVYMSQFHQNITDRLYRFVEYLESTGKRYFMAPFYTDRLGSSPVSTQEKGKFFPALILVEGYKYIHIAANGVNSVVLLEQITLFNNKPHSLIVRFLENNKREEVPRCLLNNYQILPAYRNWLAPREHSLFQFPVRLYTLTYHAALGQTIDKQPVELSADCSHANAMYVGLCCVRSYDDIIKIHSEKDLLSFVVTDYMRKELKDDEYYYRCPSNISDDDKKQIMRYTREKKHNDFIDHIKWRTVNEIQQFERKEFLYFGRIPRSVYEKPSKKSGNKGDTHLMKIVEFVKHNSHVVLDTMKNIPHEDVDKACKKGQEREYRKSSAYISLKKQYQNWSGCVREE